MENIEIKARYSDLERARQICRDLMCTFEGVLQQTDTYFHIPCGRLKLREINNCTAQLIFYERPDASGPKSSRYEIAPVKEPEAMKRLLQQSLGIWRIISKRRELYLYDEVRIHLDAVAGLGNFVELEGVLTTGGDRKSTQQKVEFLIRKLAISEAQLVPQSYSDLLHDS